MLEKLVFRSLVWVHVKVVVCGTSRTCTSGYNSVLDLVSRAGLE